MKKSKPMTGLVDCNNFFVSCERTIHPELEGKAVVVLSNNDGCIVARSNEAKRLGIRMGQPAFEVRDFITEGKLIAISGHHVLYHDISVRIHEIFRHFVPDTIDYSVDEAFLDVTGIPLNALYPIGESICKACREIEKIPVTVGFAPTKTLAKCATEIGKKSAERVVVLHESADIANVLREMPVRDLWGIGRRLARRLYFDGIFTALDFANAEKSFIRSRYGVVGERTWLELNSVPCITLSHIQRKLQDTVSESRTFPEDVNDFNYIKSRLAIYASDCARRLRAMHGKTSEVTIFMGTNPFREQQFLTPSATMRLKAPTSDSSILASVASHLLTEIFNPALAYKRAGVIFTSIVHEDAVHDSLFDEQPASAPESKRLMAAVDKVNEQYLNPILRLASNITKSTTSHNDGYSSTFQFRSGTHPPTAKDANDPKKR